MTGLHITRDALIRDAAAPAKGILSQTLQEDEHVNIVLFGFAPGEKLSEHTASVPAMLYFVQGEATITLGEEISEATAGSWVYMQPKLVHSVVAKTPVVMLLTLIKGEG
jgi:quercetin dioxygenase-like cupin family protein